MVIALSLARVGVRYGARQAVCDVTIDSLRAGEVVAVIGPNAAGKSSLFRRIAGLVAGDGVVTIGDGLKRPCYLPQDTSVNAVLTVYESILLAMKQGGHWHVSEDELATIDTILKRLSIERLAFRNLGELSGGQRQIVSIAQALAREPDILLLDEPTSALDLHRQFEVLGLVRELARERKMLILVAIHDLNQAMRVADKVMVLAQGRLVALGRPGEVITAALLDEVYGVTARVEPARGALPPYVIVEGSSRAAA